MDTFSVRKSAFLEIAFASSPCLCPSCPSPRLPTIRTFGRALRRLSLRLVGLLVICFRSEFSIVGLRNRQFTTPATTFSTFLHVAWASAKKNDTFHGVETRIHYALVLQCLLGNCCARALCSRICLRIFASRTTPMLVNLICPLTSRHFIVFCRLCYRCYPQLY